MEDRKTLVFGGKGKTGYAKDFTEYARETAATGIWIPSNQTEQTT